MAGAGLCSTIIEFTHFCALYVCTGAIFDSLYSISFGAEWLHSLWIHFCCFCAFSTVSFAGIRRPAVTSLAAAPRKISRRRWSGAAAATPCCALIGWRAAPTTAIDVALRNQPSLPKTLCQEFLLTQLHTANQHHLDSKKADLFLTISEESCFYIVGMNTSMNPMHHPSHAMQMQNMQMDCVYPTKMDLAYKYNPVPRMNQTFVDYYHSCRSKRFLVRFGPLQRGRNKKASYSVDNLFTRLSR